MQCVLTYRIGSHVDDHVNEEDNFLFVGPEQVALMAGRGNIQGAQVRRGRRSHVVMAVANVLILMVAPLHRRLLRTSITIRRFDIGHSPSPARDKKNLKIHD